MTPNTRQQVFLTSCLILFLELALIRYLPAQISYLGYYSNFILLASFVGMGGGMLLARKSYDLRWLFPWLLLIILAAGSVLAVSIYPDSGGEIHFTSSFRGVLLPELLAVPVIFILVAAIFACASQPLGRYFRELKPLTAYAFDIAGSLTGIALFTLAAWARLGPPVWFALSAALFLFVHLERSRRWMFGLGALVLGVLIVTPTSLHARWSPYQKITTEPVTITEGVTGYRLYANNVGHQLFIQHQYLDRIYHLPYQLFSSNSFQRALIIGAGAGNDVEVALANGVEKIDAVEIDPEILAVGRKLHPEAPYADPRVTAHVNDARSFLENTRSTYDLIIFALPDSLILASGRGNIRLESFLFTNEAFAAAREHLAPNGLLVLYNYYRKPWLVEKFAGMLKETFNQPPYVLSEGEPGYLTILMAGDKLRDLAPSAPASLKLPPSSPEPATDDWPFPYLKQRSLPWTYLIMLGIIGLIVYLSLSAMLGARLHRHIEPTYFWLGVAFLLLETTALVRFSLLFGTTWLVNSLVFFAILSLVLLAVWLTSHTTVKRLWVWYLGLGLALLIQFAFPLRELLALSTIAKYISVSLLTLLPVFFANIIFAYTFKNSQENDANFSSNILGAALGGILEYAALALGYSNLTLVAMLCYALAFGLPYWRYGRAQQRGVHAT